MVGFGGKQSFVASLHQMAGMYKKGGHEIDPILNNQLADGGNETDTILNNREPNVLRDLMRVAIRDERGVLFQELVAQERALTEMFGSRRFHDKVLQSLLLGHLSKAKVYPKSIKLLLDAYAPSLSKKLYWRFLSDDYRHRLNDPEAAAIAGLKFIESISMAELEDYHDFISLVAKNLQNTSQLRALCDLLLGIKRDAHVFDHLVFLSKKLGLEQDHRWKVNSGNQDVYFISRYNAQSANGLEY